MAAIFVLSAQPHEGPPMGTWEIVARKVGHFSGYALLALAWAWALEGLVARPRLWAAAISFVYACSDEYHQTFVDGRTGKLADVAIDSLGIAVGLLLVAPAYAAWRGNRAASSRSVEMTRSGS